MQRIQTLHVRSLVQLAPDLVAAAIKRTRATRLVADGLQGDRWTVDIEGSLSVFALTQDVASWERMPGLQLAQDREDKFVWKWCPATSSTRRRQPTKPSSWVTVQSQVLKSFARLPHCKFFIWLALLDHCWTSACLQRNHLQNNGSSALCSQAGEFIEQLTISCVFNMEVWFRLLRAAGFQFLVLTGSPSMVDWWLPSRK
jgi:hypothetical protein